MRVKMLEDAPGSPDGVTVVKYDDGVVYEVSDALGVVFIANGHAEETDEEVAWGIAFDPETDAAYADNVAPKPKRRGGRKASTPAENK